MARQRAESACALVVRPVLGTYEVLGLRRRHPPRGWAMPGGGVEEGENSKKAAIRELEEETGIHANPLATYKLYVGPCPNPLKRDYDIVATYLILEHDGVPCAQPPPHDEGKVAWVSPRRLLTGPFGTYVQAVWWAFHEFEKNQRPWVGLRRRRA
jgi:8-oxo-dGTP diphosphatase